MNKLELINKKLELRKEAESMLNSAKTEKRELNKVEDQKFEEIRKQMKEIDEEISKIEKNLEAEKRNADEMKHINNKRNMAKYSILNAIRSQVNGSQMDEATANAVKIATEENRAAGLSADGIVIPAFETRDGDLVAKVKANGGETVATELDGLLTPLYDNQVLGQFTWMTGLKGNVAIPRMTAGNVGWADEIAEASQSANTFDSVTLSPKRLTAYVNISKQLILQSNESIEAVVRQDIVNALNDKLQKTLLGDGAASATQPAGIFNGADALTKVDFASLVNIEEEIEEANTVATGYVINPYVKAQGRQTLKSEAVAGYLFDNGQLLGQSTAVTNAAKGIVYGNLKDFVIGQWGNIELTVDPYTRAKNGEVQIVINAYFDAVKRREDTIVAKTVAKAGA